MQNQINNPQTQTYKGNTNALYEWEARYKIFSKGKWTSLRINIPGVATKTAAITRFEKITGLSKYTIVSINPKHTL